jgi:hypothetical protein
VTDETIQQDVSDADQTSDQQPEQDAPVAEEKPDYRSPRERKMAEVAEKRREKQEADRKAFALINDPDLSEEDYDARVAAEAGDTEQDDEEQDDDPVAQEADQKPIRAGFEDRGDGTLVKKLKVNGREVELTEEEYDRQLSKDLAGDQKLRLAAERERALAEREQRIAQMEQRGSQQEPPDLGANAVDLDAALSEYHDAVYAGDQDAAREKLKAVMMQGRQSSTPNIDELVSSVATRVKAEADNERYRESVQKGMGSFKKDYAHIVADPAKLAYADARLKEITQTEPDLSPEEAILKAGKMAAEVWPDDTPGKRGSTTDAERTQRKANLKPVPNAGSRQSRSDKKPDVDMSPAAKIARMRSGRAL